MFDLYGTERLASWKNFRNQLEHSSAPLLECARLWSKAPFVAAYLDPFNPKSWPDPWKLVLDSKLDDLAITLGMFYTLQLTERFKNDVFKIYIKHDKKENRFILQMGEKYIVNLYDAHIENHSCFLMVEFDVIFSTKN